MHYLIRRLKAQFADEIPFLLAFRNLSHDRLRFAVTLIGVVFAVILITVQLGLFLGFTRSITGVIEHTRADLWVAARGTPNFDQATDFSDRHMHRLLDVPGVAGIERMIARFNLWKKPQGGEESVVIVGYDLATGSLQPWNVVQGSLAALNLPDTVAVDRLYLKKLGVRGVGDTAEINGHRARVVAVTEGIRSFTTSPFVFTSLRNSLGYAGLSEDRVSYLLVHAAPGVSTKDLKRRLQREVPELDVYLHDEFWSKTLDSWMFNTGAGSALIMAALLGLIVGMVVVAQTLYASTVDHLNEFGTLRAMGADNAFLYRVILLQAMMSAALGYVAGMIISLVIMRATQASVTAIVITPVLGFAMLVVTVLMCAVGAVTSIRKVMRIEPAMVFKA